MDFKEWLLTERRGEYNVHNTIVVDIQQSYEPFFLYDIPVAKFAEFLLQTLQKRKNVLYFYNGETIGTDEDEGTISEWLANLVYEYDPYDDEEDEMHERWNQIYATFRQSATWYDKGYGFFRDWMDMGVSETTLIRTIRYMVMNRVYDSRDIDDKALKDLLKEDFHRKIGNIHIPSISLGQLKQFDGCHLCGGGKEECLKEVQLLMNAFNIKYRLLERFIF